MKKVLITFLCCTLTFASCSDWFDAPTDGTEIDAGRLFTNDNAFLNALADVYTQLREPELYGYNLSLLPDFAAQNFIPDTETLSKMADHRYDAPEIGRIIRDVWKNLYRAIASCNEILSHIETTDVTFRFAGQREIITGELYALRGTLHFELLRLFHPHPAVDPSFAGMPYMTAFGSGVGKALTTAQVVELIEKDLDRALELLEGRDPLFSPSQTYSVQPGQIDRRLRTFHLNYYAVSAVMARLKLWCGDYPGAFEYADQTFGHIRNTPSLSARIFHWFGPGEYGSDLSFSREHVFGIASGPEGFTAVSEELFGSRGITAGAGFGSTFPLAADTRRRDWFVLGADGYVMSPKFSRESLLSNYTSTAGHDRVLPVRIPFIKLGEAALIAAEALNEQGLTADAAQWVVELQAKRDITTVKDLLDASQLTQAALRAEIRAEYRREFYGEGQLFHFHKRHNDAILDKYDGTTIAMAPADYTFPIPANGLSAAGDK